MKISEIKIPRRTRRDMGDLDGLAASIQEVGLLHLPVVDGENELVCGERRVRAVKKLGWEEVPVRTVRTLGEALLALKAERDENTCRKDFVPSEAVALGERLEKMLKPEAEKREKAGKAPSGKLPQGRVSDAVGSAVGMGRRTYEKAKAVVAAAKANPGLVSVAEEMDRTGNVEKAFRAQKKAAQIAVIEEIAKKSPQTIDGRFDVIVVDPPWPMEKIERDCRENQVAFDYPTMKVTEIEAMTIGNRSIEEVAARSSHVFLWTTHRFLPDAFGVLKLWGAKYRATFVWYKSGGFQPVGFPQFNCEFCLWGCFGSPVFTDTKAFNLCFEAKRGKHSEKPEFFYEMLRRVTAGRRLDVFNRREIEGFVGYGNQAQ